VSHRAASKGIRVFFRLYRNLQVIMSFILVCIYKFIYNSVLAEPSQFVPHRREVPQIVASNGFEGESSPSRDSASAPSPTITMGLNHSSSALQHRTFLAHAAMQFFYLFKFLFIHSSRQAFTIPHMEVLLPRMGQASEHLPKVSQEEVIIEQRADRTPGP